MNGRKGRKYFSPVVTHHWGRKKTRKRPGTKAIRRKQGKLMGKTCDRAFPSYC